MKLLGHSVGEGLVYVLIEGGYKGYVRESNKLSWEESMPEGGKNKSYLISNCSNLGIFYLLLAVKSEVNIVGKPILNTTVPILKLIDKYILSLYLSS